MLGILVFCLFFVGCDGVLRFFFRGIFFESIPYVWCGTSRNGWLSNGLESNSRFRRDSDRGRMVSLWVRGV